MEYAWERRWIPSDVGESEGSGDTSRSRSFKALWQMRFSDDGLLLQSMAATPCLILLGEPGMGKTYAVGRESRGLADREAEYGVVRLVDLLGSASSEEVGVRLFGNDWYRNWKSGGHRLTCFVDSVDRSGVPVDEIMTVLRNELVDADLGRLRLRLVCRDYDWSVSFADGLRSIWGETSDGVSNVQVFQLAPLSQDDIRLAAKSNELDPEDFLKDLETADALALAAIPITLEMLLQTGELTSNRLKLYEKGIRRLCRQAEERVVSEKRLSERVRTAASMAAVMLLGDKYSVDIESESIGESVLSVRDLLRDTDSESEEKLARETLKTGLFQGGRQRSWIHQSFAEYLAAVYLSSPKVKVKEIVKLTTNGDGVFSTQLYEVLRWLIELRQDVLKEIVERHPSLLLTTDLSHLDEKDFRYVYKAMLNLDDAYVYQKRSWDLKTFRATHPSAGQVLLPYLQDNEDNIHRRRFVLDLLESHGYPDMDDVLVNLALNEDEDDVLRRWAARGLWKVGSVEAKLKLKPYICGSLDDPEDEIKGYALQSLWPDHVSAEELFKALLPPKRESYYGSYKVFLISDNIFDGLQPGDLPFSLNWVATQPPRHEMPFSLQDLPGKIMRNAWENRHYPGVLEAFARTAVSAIVRFDGIFGTRPNTYPSNKELDEFEHAFVDDTQTRRDLILLTLPHLLAKDVEAWRLRFTWPPMVIPDDLDWLLGLLESESDEARRGQLAGLVARLASYDIEKVYEASERHPEVRERTKHYFESRLDDPNVISEREHFHKMKELDKRIAQQRAEVQPLEVIATALHQLELGETWQWHNVIYGLSLHPEQNVISWEISPDLTEYPNWGSCDDHTQRRIAQAAETYLCEQKLKDDDDGKPDWYFTNSIPRIEYSAYFAIFLLHKINVGAPQLSVEESLRKWSKVVVWFPYVPIVLNDGRTEYHEHTQDLQRDLLSRLYRIAPRALLDNLRQLLVANDSRDSYIRQELDKVEHLWDPTFEATLLNLLRESSLSVKGNRSLLDFLLKHGNAAAVSYAEELISSGYSNDEQKCLLIEFCISLMASTCKYEWPIVWNAIQSCDDLGKAIVESVAKEERLDAKFGAHLNARELADLFIWTQERYPAAEDPEIDGVHMVSPREEVGRWRNNIITELRKKDSQEALLEIRRILDRCPQLEWIQYARVDLEATVEELDWKPALPSEVLDLTVVKESRPQKLSSKAVVFLKHHGKWIVGFAAKYLTNIIGPG